MFLELELVKKHLNIDDDYTEDDEYILSLISVAEETVQMHIDGKLIDLCEYDENGEVDPKTLPSPLIHAMKLFIGTMYANRENIAYATPSEVPFSYTYLLSLYQKYK